jgi:hypothetical protein
MNFGSPTEAARISTEKALEQSVTKVPILAVQTTEVYNISIPEALTFSQILRKQGLSLAGG